MIGQELQETRTARWYQAVRCAHRTGAWSERVRCYIALSAILAEQRASQAPGECRRQPPIQVPGILTEVARRAHFASAEPVYKRWRAKPDGQHVGRWAGPSPAIKPGVAFVAEAKIVSFWPYREGILEVADAFDMTRTEIAASYLRALAAWASEDTLLAACHPAGPPECVTEDMEVLAGRFPRAADSVSCSLRARCLAKLAGDVVGRVLQDASITSLGAFNTVRDEVLGLLAEPSNPITDQVACSVAELSDRLLHQGDDEAVLTADQADRMLTALSELSSLLAHVAAGTQ